MGSNLIRSTKPKVQCCRWQNHESKRLLRTNSISEAMIRLQSQHSSSLCRE